MPKMEVNGIHLYYELHGPEDADVLVLSNGVLMSTASWVYQTPVFSRYYRLLLYDCRGMWQSDHPPGPYSMDLHADDLVALLKALGIERAHIAGASYGAEISMVFALKYPQKVRSLIVAAAVSQIDPLLKGIADSWVAAVQNKDPEMFFHITYPVNFSEAWIAANQATLKVARERYETLNFDALLELLRSFCQLDITSELHKIVAPSLVIVGEKDALKPRKYAEIIAREIPKSEFAVIPHAGHALMWEQPGVFNALILGFLAMQSNRSG
jgi:3-oxoadipate enol-lactonase